MISHARLKCVEKEGWLMLAEGWSRRSGEREAAWGGPAALPKTPRFTQEPTWATASCDGRSL